ncbi:MAG TPA: SpoIIE family protein phosphatase [Spirochaetota bacterium]
MKDKRKTHKMIFSLRIKFSLAMILTTAAVIVVMAIYFINRQGEMLLRDSINLAERETEHLAVTTNEALSTSDELTIISALNSTKNLRSVKYAYVIDPEGIAIQSTDLGVLGAKLSDLLTSKAMEYSGRGDQIGNAAPILTQKIQDPDDRAGTLYDFSKPIFDKLTGKKRIATVRLGISDRNVRAEIAVMKRFLALITLVFLGISTIIAIILATLTTRPLKVLSAGVKEIGSGKLDYKITVNSRDEIGMLASQFNSMTDQLKEAQSREIENRIMQEQLDVAKEIQEGLNPMTYYNKNGIQIKGYTRAAKGVGGDYFDYIEIGDDRVGALISDVSGKGIPASLVMVMIRTVFVSSLRQDPRKIQCSKIVSAINASLSADFAIDKFATLFFMIYDRTKGTVSFSNAGHGPLFCYRADRNQCTITKLEGVPIGIMDDSEYSQAEVPFGIGDIIVLNTDGVTEMRNEKKEEYGRMRVQQFLMKHHDLSADQIVSKMVEDVDAFQGNAPQHDDMTLLIMKRIG